LLTVATSAAHAIYSKSVFELLDLGQVKSLYDRSHHRKIAGGLEGP
jgi:hypothetical protein